MIYPVGTTVRLKAPPSFEKDVTVLDFRVEVDGRVLYSVEGVEEWVDESFLSPIPLSPEHYDHTGG